MRRLAAALLVLLAAAPAAALEVPPRTSRYVNDYAELFDAGEEARLESYLRDLDRRTSNQIVVVTLGSLEGNTAEEVTLRFAEAWKPGRADVDNGVVVGVYPNDRQARIEVGYGLEGAIPDASAMSILQNEMLPHYRGGAWFEGTLAGVQALAAAAAGEYSAPAASLKAIPGWVIVLFILVFFGFWAAIAFTAAKNGYAGYGPRSRSYRGHWGGGPGWGGSGRGGFGGFGGGGGGFGGGGATGRW